MSLSSQMKLLRAFREILLGNPRAAFAPGCSAKPSFTPGKQPKPLPRSTPEAEGVSSHQIRRFVTDIATDARINAHSYLILRNGSVISEGSFAPYRSDVWHVAHSLCKSFTGAATGLAIHEGLFDLDTPVYQHFPAESGLIPSKNMRKIAPRHLLTMTSGIAFNEVDEAINTHWLRGLFASPVLSTPGERFSYNSMNSYLLAALICKTSGGSLVEFLQSRLFEPMGFGSVGWETSPDGFEKGGWGMYLHVEDMAKFGQLYLQNGQWTLEDGRVTSLLPQTWVQDTVAPHGMNDKGEYYGYQIWLDTVHNSWIMNGMFGQYVAIFPQQNMVIAMTSGSPRLFTDSPAYTLMCDYFAKASFSTSALPHAPLANANLRALEGSLSIKMAHGKTPSPVQTINRPPRAQRWEQLLQQNAQPYPKEALAFCGNTWLFEKNKAGLLPLVIQAMDNQFSLGLRSVELRLDGDAIRIVVGEPDGFVTLPIAFHGKPAERRVTVGRDTFLVACIGDIRPNEDGQDVMILKVCFLEHSSYRTIKLRLSGEHLALEMDESPQIMHAIELAMNQNTSTSGASNSMGDRVQKNEYLLYRLAQLCTPSLLGHLKPAEEPEPPPN